MKHYTVAIDFSEAVKTTDGTDEVYTFDYNIRDAILQADEVNFFNFVFSGLKMWGGLVVTQTIASGNLYMFVAGTTTHGFTNVATEPNVIRWVTDS